MGTPARKRAERPCVTKEWIGEPHLKEYILHDPDSGVDHRVSLPNIGGHPILPELSTLFGLLPGFGNVRCDVSLTREGPNEKLRVLQNDGLAKAREVLTGWTTYRTELGDSFTFGWFASPGDLYLAQIHPPIERAVFASGNHWLWKIHEIGIGKVNDGVTYCQVYHGTKLYGPGSIDGLASELRKINMPEGDVSKIVATAELSAMERARFVAECRRVFLETSAEPPLRFF